MGSECGGSECGGQLEARFADRNGKPSRPSSRSSVCRGNASQPKATPLRATGSLISQSTSRSSPPAMSQLGSKAAIGSRSKAGDGGQGAVVKQSAPKRVAMVSAKRSVESLTMDYSDLV